MKRLLLVLMLVLMVFPVAMAEGIHTLVEQNGLYGLNDAQGNMVIPCEYEVLTFNWLNDCYYARKDGKYGVLDAAGETLIPCEWDMLYFTGEDWMHCRVFQGTLKTNWRLGDPEPDEGLWGLYTIDGTELYSCEWPKMDAATYGVLVVGKDGKWGAINLAGEVVVPCEWDGLLVAENGSCIHVYKCVPAEDGESVCLEGLLSLDGSAITPCQWLSVNSFSEGLAAVRQEDGYGFINASGEVVIPCKWDFAWDFSGGYAKVEKNGLWGVIDTSGTLVVPCEWETLEDLGDGQFKGTKSTMIDLSN